jgi:IS1 transposase
VKSEEVIVEVCRSEELDRRRVLTSELDEMWSYVRCKANPRWLWHAIDHHTGTVLAYGRAPKVGGAEIPESYSHYAMTGEQLPRLGISGDRGVGHVYHRVLDIGVPQPVLHERDIRTGVQQMDRDRMA